MIDIEFQTNLITAKDLLKALDIASSGGMAKHMIKEIGIVVNKEVFYEAGKKLRKGDEIIFNDEFHISLI
ncbi:RNA-binding S4 domain-containing protein [Anaerococcus sp. AGMB00486]|uniref:RNA-binding S4 domain-containing protein n=2 Tax=Anaerococcus TaxID=165779 RepID=A0ABX2N9M4_9FIRM|nr:MULTISPECIES: RNA-binding S4 domain-containing protein [Anaerococcus]MDY3005851.1 RNA-binding S4 domain-containing protein [Anaerococcus porci]MSS77592.1 RNA-binding S4 domain-containing protein [Anaerococcus porci]NVF11264.1 RNA-binding S4 domain-containing protein [Anaerococcus faecalis]